MATARKNSEVDKLAASQSGQKARRHLVGCLALGPTMTDVWQELTHTVRGAKISRRLMSGSAGGADDAHSQWKNL